MPMEGRVKCLSPQNTFGVLGVNSVAANPTLIEVNSDHFLKLKKILKCLHTAPVVSVSLDIQIWLEMASFTPCFLLLSSLICPSFTFLYSKCWYRRREVAEHLDFYSNNLNIVKVTKQTWDKMYLLKSYIVNGETRH